MGRDLARADNRIDTSSLDDRAGHTPKRIRSTSQGSKDHKVDGVFGQQHDEKLKLFS